STINSTNPINSFCFLPGKKQLVDSNAQIWNWEEEILIRKVGKEQFTLRTIDAINCHPDGKKFVLASSNQVYFMTSDDLTYYSNQPLGKNSFVDAVHFFHRSDLVIAVSSEGNNTITEK
ncbi:MAG: hypothetical protein KDK36_13680, partial [Leptospiraceae bacterium]|nr:hypothetical protein [Leptospiraceae bacterium]